MEPLEHLIKQYQLLTDWYLSVLEGIDDRDGNKTISDNTNSLEWLAGHLLVGRYRNMVRLGIPVEPYKDLNKFVNEAIPPPNAIAFDRSTEYPGLTENKQQWNEYSKMFLDGLRMVNETTLQTDVPFNIPTGGHTILDALTFVVLHETFHIGQMSIIRKGLGYTAMQLLPRAK